MKNPMITFMCLGLLVLSGCSHSPVFFSLDTSIAPEKYLEQGIAIDSLNGMLRMVSSKDDSTVTLFVPTIASDLVDPTITVVAENKAMETALFGPANIAAIQQGQIRLAYNFNQWSRLLQQRKNNESWLIFAGAIGAIVILDELLDHNSKGSRHSSHRHHTPFPANSWYFSSHGRSSVNFNYWAFDRFWYNAWHGPTGHLYYLNHNNYYNSVQLESIVYASGNYLQQKLINGGELASGTVVLPFDSKTKYSNMVVKISMGSEVHEFNLALNNPR